MLLEIAKISALWFVYSNSIFSSSTSSDSQIFKHGNISDWLWKTKRETEDDRHPKCLIASVQNMWADALIIVNLSTLKQKKVKCHLLLKRKGLKPLNNNYLKARAIIISSYMTRAMPRVNLFCIKNIKKN